MVTQLDRAQEYIGKAKWVFAKSYARTAPHEYTVRKWSAELEPMFVEFVLFIRSCGYQKTFGGRAYTYLTVDGWRYWTMGAPVSDTIIINRARDE